MPRRAGLPSGLAIAPEMNNVKTNLGLSLALAGQGNQAVQMLQPIATAPDATAMKRADLAVALAQESDRGPAGPVKEQQAQAATVDYDLPIAINRAPISSVRARPCRQRWSMKRRHRVRQPFRRPWTQPHGRRSSKL